MAQVSITGITGGRASSPYLYSNGQFLNSVGIDPDFALTDGTNDYLASGILRPTSYSAFGGANIVATPKWIVTNPKNNKIYTLLDDGKFVSYDSDYTNETLIATASTCTANGLAYYNNYIYVFRNTDVDRYGPLDGTPSYTTGVWTGATLGSQTALQNTTYPTMRNSVTMPNHVAFVHSDGALYFADFVNGQGVLHKIKTTKTTDEGDTDNGSSYNVLDLPFGQFPTAISSIGTSVAIGAMQTTDSSINQGRANLYLWDALSDSFYADVPLPDPVVSALMNSNGYLYIFSGNLGDNGHRISYYAGSQTVKTLVFSSDGHPPMAGAVEAIGDKILWGTINRVQTTSSPNYYAVVMSLNSKDPRLPSGIQCPVKASCTATSANGIVSAVKAVSQTSFARPEVILGWRSGSSYDLDKISTTYGTSVFQTPIVNVGRQFIIKRIRINLAESVSANMTITPTVFLDDLTESTTTGMRVINSTNYPNSERFVEWKCDINGDRNFFLQLEWSGTALLPVLLPIDIEVEVKPID